MVDTNMVGRKRRMNNPSNFHPMIREEWLIRDEVRGALGEYYTTYKSRKGETLVNYAYILKNLREGNWEGINLLKKCGNGKRNQEEVLTPN